MKNWQKNIFLDMVAFLFGIILPFAFAPYEIFPIAVVSPAVLILTCLNSTSKRAFWRGFLFGLGFFGLGVYWVFISVHTFGDVPIPLALLITASLTAMLAFFPALTVNFTLRFARYCSKTMLLFSFAVFWVFSEWIRSWLFTGFPWLLLGTSQTNSPLKGYAAIFSVYGVSLAVLISGCCIVNAVLLIRSKRYAASYLNVFVVAALWMSGSVLCHIHWTKPAGTPIPVSLIQGNIPQEIKWSPEHLQFSLDRYQQLTEPLFEHSPQIIIWPEAAVPLPLPEAQSYINALNTQAQQHNVTLILGIPLKVSNKNGYFNAIISLGNEKRQYIKRHLVPFGEYTPFYAYLSSLLSFMNIPMSDLIAGKPDQDLFIINGVKILTNICYEIAFPEQIRSKDAKIGFILTLTNDAWFGKSNASAQHLQMAQMRALELSRPAIVVGNDGITAIIGPNGNIQAAAPQYETFVLKSFVQPMQGLTPWMKVGMDPILILLLSMLFIVIRARTKYLCAAKKNTSKAVLAHKSFNAGEDQLHH